MAGKVQIIWAGETERCHPKGDEVDTMSDLLLHSHTELQKVLFWSMWLFYMQPMFYPKWQRREYCKVPRISSPPPPPPPPTRDLTKSSSFLNECISITISAGTNLFQTLIKQPFVSRKNAFDVSLFYLIRRSNF